MWDTEARGFISSGNHWTDSPHPLLEPSCPDPAGKGTLRGETSLLSGDS